MRQGSFNERDSQGCIRDEKGAGLGHIHIGVHASRIPKGPAAYDVGIPKDSKGMDEDT